MNLSLPLRSASRLHPSAASPYLQLSSPIPPFRHNFNRPFCLNYHIPATFFGLKSGPKIFSLSSQFQHPQLIFPRSYKICKSPRHYFSSTFHLPRHFDKRNTNQPRNFSWSFSQKLILTLSASLALGSALYEFVPSFRYATVGLVRCARVAIAVVGAMWDYKTLFAKEWADDPAGHAQRHLDYQTTHLTASRRILNVLKQNGGIYVKLGQHLSSVQLIPLAWSSTMKPLQDQCTPSSFEMINQLFLKDVGVPIVDLFDHFNPTPIGVASLAQVHRAIDRQTGREVAVKVMHPSLEEYSEVDTRMVVVMLKFVKWVFPDFEFTWLGEEMQENLPKEMDFRIEAANASKCAQQFSNLRSTTLKLPDVLWAQKRVLVMEYITGGRFDDLEYLAKHNIDRNRASQELTRIFSQMIYLNGYFHADPHAGNLLIRPAPPSSRSPYNFEIVLLDHGLYFDLTDELRVHYAKLWLSLLKPGSISSQERRKYAKLVGNIEEESYDIFESAITGRVGLKGHGSLMALNKQSMEDQKLIQAAIISQEGIFAEIMKILRNVPRRLLMIFKVNDLTRSLDLSLKTTHSQTRIWLIVARFSALAIWIDDLKQFKNAFFHRQNHQRLGFFSSVNLFLGFLNSWWNYHKWYNLLRILEISMDIYAGLNKSSMYVKGLTNMDGGSAGGGFENAKRKAAGL